MCFSVNLFFCEETVWRMSCLAQSLVCWWCLTFVRVFSYGDAILHFLFYTYSFTLVAFTFVDVLHLLTVYAVVAFANVFWVFTCFFRTCWCFLNV